MRPDLEQHSAAERLAERPSACLALSPTQQLFWAGQQLHPESPLYNMAIAFSIEGPIDVDLFRAAFGRTVATHEALRTVFVHVDGEPQAQVLPHVAYELPLVDVSRAEDPVAEARRWMRAATAASLPLDKQLSLPALLRIDSGRYVFFLCQHHLVTDASSFGVIFQTLSNEYKRLLDGGARSDTDILSGESDRPDDASRQPQMSDHLDDLARFSESSMGKSARRHWKEVANKEHPSPRYYGRDAGRTATRVLRLRCDPGANWRDRLLSFVARDSTSLSQDAALFDVLATWLYATLYRVTGQSQHRILVPSHNRSRAAAKRTAGVLIEMFEHGVDVEAGETFATLLEKVASETRTFLRFAVPGAGAGVPFGAGVVLNYIKAAYPDFSGMDTSAEWIHAGHADPHHAVRLQVYDFGATGDLTLFVDLNEAVFGKDNADRFVAHFESVARSFLDEPDAVIDEVDILSLPERKALVNLSRGPHAQDVPDVTDVLATIWKFAVDTPSAPALVFGDTVYSYRELRSNVHAVVRGLIDVGVEPGDVVAIDIRRSGSTVVLMLAALEVGATFLPVDRSAPAARRRFVVDNSGARVVVLDRADQGQTYEGCRSLLLDDVLRVREENEQGTTADLDSEIDDGVAAYVIYTSGSTGEPKGVRVGRRALSNYVHWAVDTYARDGQPITMPVFTNPAVDLTLTSIFVPLASGGTTVVYDDDADDAGTALPVVLREDRCNVIKMTPSHVPIFLQARLGGESLKTVILGGENLRTDVARDIAAHLGDGVAIFNEYGPTEATIGCVAHQFDPVVDREAHVPVGHPINNTRLAVLNGARKMVPAGVEGELYIAGACLADGYLGNPDETSVRFVSDLEGLPGRWYRTGDVVRLNDNGRLVCVGRADDQVKIRGHRVEPAEIERAITAVSGIRAAAVLKVSGTREQSVKRHCTRCGISSEYPFVTFNEVGLCSTCRAFEAVEPVASRYFGEMSELHEVLLDATSTGVGAYDCMMLLSGGKDSTYALYRLVHMGLRVYTFTLDNGYISDQAKANINRVVADLGVTHEYGSTDAMNEIFVDSLRRFSNVCNGCFKTLYTLAVQAARREGIGVIVTGLSRGQFFETRLTEEMFTLPTLDPDGIDDAVLAARKRYHRSDDAVSRLLDTSVFDDDRVFDEVRFVDFYRYCDASLEEMMAYLDAHAPWVRPADTGRSTNCLINDVGIHVHKLERGFHNYALPYAWDVRMGCKTREEAMDELEDEIDERNVERILDEIGYEPVPKLDDPWADRLVAYYVSDNSGDDAKAIDAARLKSVLSADLPRHMVPDAFVRVDELPLTSAGKLDRHALPAAAPGGAGMGATGEADARQDVASVAPRNPIEETVAEIWRHVLGIPHVGVTDSFVSLGGTSLLAIRVVARISRAFGIDVPLRAAFERPTIEQVALLVEELLIADIQNESS